VSKSAWSSLRAGIVPSLLLVLVTACSAASGTGKFPTLGVTTTRVSQPASTATVILHPPTVVPNYTDTYTPVPKTSEPTVTSTPQVPSTTSPRVVFAAIGDYGSGNQDEADVAKLILGWQPDFVITLGDNNYPSGAADHMDDAVGQFFHNYIYPYVGSFGEGAQVNRFFPTLGNHDWISESGKPYFDYFTLPGNERYYDFTWGPVHFFALNDLDSEPDGVGMSSIQAEWLKAGLAGSTSAWNIVYMHYAPYSSGTHGSTDWARWPYAEWGADAVLAGHDHTYERLVENGLVYFVNGLGGAGRYEFLHHVEGSQVRYNADYGAMRVEAMESMITFEFITRTGEVVDKFEIMK
jgi:tartrate-resistant acid phosphatase type 5